MPLVVHGAAAQEAVQQIDGRMYQQIGAALAVGSHDEGSLPMPQVPTIMPMTTVNV